MTPELLAALKTQTVLIDVYSPSTDDNNEGSGVIIAHDGSTYTVLTVKHLVTENPSYGSITIRTNDGNSYDAKAVKQCDSEDLMTMTFQTKASMPVAAIATSLPDIGSTMEIVANPLNHHWNDAQVAMYGLDSQHEYIYGDACVGVCGHGQSGGGLYDQAGKLIGIAYASSNDAKAGSIEQVFINISRAIQFVAAI